MPFENLIEELQATLSEREQVIAMGESGVVGPYVFEKSVWKNVDLLEGFVPEGDLVVPESEFTGVFPLLPEPFDRTVSAVVV